MSGAGPRVHVRPEAVSGTRVVLDAEEARYLRRVLRLRVGDLVRALDGHGRELTVRLTALGTRSAEGEILDSATPARESPLHLTLAQGLPKADKLETIIRMSTELGVAAVVPLLTSRTGPVGAGRQAERRGNQPCDHQLEELLQTPLLYRLTRFRPPCLAR